MTLSRWLLRGWCVVVALGVGLAELEWSALVATALLVGVFACLATAAAMLPPSHGGLLGRRRWTSCLLVAGSVVALLAVASASSAVTLLVGLLAVVTLAPVLALDRARRVPARQRPKAEPDAPERDLSFEGLDGLDGKQLCSLWRDLLQQLADQCTPAERAATVARRQACLEEIERRNPDAVRAWISAGARACDGPDRFLTGQGRAGGNTLS